MVEDYVYLGSFISSSEKDFNTRKGMAWSACNDMHKIWTSQLPKKIKLQIFRATVEPILLYGSETWTLSKKLEKSLDGTYTRLLMRAQNLSWKRHPSISDIYGNLPRVSALVRSRRVQFAGHCYRAESEVISSLLLWKSNQVLTMLKAENFHSLKLSQGIQGSELRNWGRLCRIGMFGAVS